MDSLLLLLMIGILLAHKGFAQDPSLTISPNPVDEGDQVDITCSYTVEGEEFVAYIYHENTVVCSYTDKYTDFNIRSAFVDRIDHTPPPKNYKTGFTITLKNITKDDKGTYRCSAHRSTVIDSTIELEVYVPPRAMEVFMSSQPPYTESKEKLISGTSKSYDPLHGVTCSFSIYPNITSALIWPYTIIRGNDRKTPSITSVVLKDGLYDVRISVPFPLTRVDNGNKSLSCEVTWRRTNRKYSAQLESPLNVTFSATNGISMSMNGTILVENNSTTSPICTWGSANPPGPITWIYKDLTVSADNIGDQPALPSTSHYEAGKFHGQTTVSRLTVTRELNQRDVSCCVTDENPLKCEHSELLNVRFPPTTATITTSGVPIVGETMSLTCTTDSSHPHSNITWLVPSHWQTDTTNTTELTVKPGDFGGTRSTSKITFVVREEDLQKQFECSVIWNGKEIPGLNATHYLGATTTIPPATSTTVDDRERNIGGSRNNPPAEGDNTNLIIGLAVGLGGAVILITVILAVIMVRAKKRKQRPQDRADNAGDKNPETAHDYETVDEELNEVPDESQQISMIEPEPDYADIGNGNSYTETPVSDPPKSPPETLSNDDETHTYAQVNKPQRGLPDVVSPGVRRDDPDSDEDPEGPPVSERLGEPAIVPAEAEQPPTDEQKHPEIKKSKPVVDKSKKPRKPGKKPEDPYSEIGDRTPNVVTQKSEPNYAEINPSQKKNVVPTPTERTEYSKVDFIQDHENDEDVTGDTDSD